MSDIIWKWKKGSINIFTRQSDIAKEALKKGEYVTTLKNKPRIFVHSHQLSK